MMLRNKSNMLHEFGVGVFMDGFELGLVKPKTKPNMVFRLGEVK